MLMRMKAKGMELKIERTYVDLLDLPIASISSIYTMHAGRFLA